MLQDDYWLSVYVLLSRLRSFDDLVVLRLPQRNSLEGGPPSYLTTELNRLRALELETIRRLDTALNENGFLDLQATISTPLLNRLAQRSNHQLVAASSDASHVPSPLLPRKRKMSSTAASLLSAL